MDPILSEILAQEWYTQGFPARPLFLTTVVSTEYMKTDAGFTYKRMFFTYKGDYCEANYLHSDLVAHADRIMQELHKDPSFLSKIREKNEKTVKSLAHILENPFPDFKNLSDAQVVARVQQNADAMERGMGGAHLIESISLRLERSIRHLLAKKTSGKELNESFSILTAPITQSFLSEKEEALWRIKNSSGLRDKKRVESFIKEFFWVNSSYVQSVPWTQEAVRDEANKVTHFKKPDFTNLKKQKVALIKKYSFSAQEQLLFSRTECLTDWQDHRKKHIYKAIFAMDAAVRELSKRFGVSAQLLHYLLPSEFSVKSLSDGSAKRLAKKRIEGCINVRDFGHTYIFDGKEYSDFKKAFEKHHAEVDILIGMAASLGSATGPVRICNTLESLSKVQQGDILVASMTRPEYVSAMKKAAAIVTDEGG
ncbi:MAG: PEP-utilizing enzyme, partial [Candidatus Diapherotrites archaeon]|nr:PEP-utilizing enzyme [Candidatus Diapherotrites archaeon]